MEFCYITLPKLSYKMDLHCIPGNLLHYSTNIVLHYVTRTPLYYITKIKYWNSVTLHYHNSIRLLKFYNWNHGILLHYINEIIFI